MLLNPTTASSSVTLLRDTLVKKIFTEKTDRAGTRRGITQCDRILSVVEEFVGLQ
jgi:hypothetical protein